MKLNPVDDMAFTLDAHGYGLPVREHRFDRKRQWRFDLAYPDLKVSIEYEGGLWSGVSRHRTGTGYLRDLEKYNHAALAGWLVLRFAVNQVDDGSWLHDGEAGDRDAPRGGIDSTSPR